MWLVAIFLLAKITLILTACPSGSELGKNGLCYQPFAIKTTWYQAESTCVGNNGHLASVKDAFANAYLTANFPFNHTQFWLGGTTNYLGGNWSWTDFTPFIYNNWAKGQIMYSVGYCTVLRIADGKWLSSDCAQQNYFVCEYPQNQTQTYSTLPPVKNCPNNNWYYSSASNRCYYFNIIPITWNDSVTACQNLYSGASLAIIHDSQENDAIINIFNSQHPDTTAGDGLYYFLWIGLRAINGVYTWIDGSSLDFTDWGENNGLPYVRMDPANRKTMFDGNGTWWGDASNFDYISQDNNYGYVCELRV